MDYDHDKRKFISLYVIYLDKNFWDFKNLHSTVASRNANK